METRYTERSLTVMPEKPLQGPSDSPTGLGEGPTMVWPERNFHAGPTPGALQGDDVQLEYYDDGYPKLPACLEPEA